MTDMPTGWTENASIRNNASLWITQAVEELQASFPFPLVSFDSDIHTQCCADRSTRIEGVNPADLTRQINEIQTRLTNTARAKTEALVASKPLNLESLEPSINRLAPTKRKPSRAHNV